MQNKSEFPGYLAAIDKKTKRIFVLARPDLCALKVGGKWQLCSPLTDEEIMFFDLVTDLKEAISLVNEARMALLKQSNELT